MRATIQAARSRRALPARVYVCRDRDAVTGEESLTISDTLAVFADRDVVGVYALVDTKPLRARTRTRGSRRALLVS